MTSKNYERFFLAQFNKVYTTCKMAGVFPEKCSSVCTSTISTITKTSVASPPTIAKKPPPLVAVVVPVHNAEGFITECLQSLLGQSSIPLNVIELCIYEDSSTDRSWHQIQQLLPRLEISLHTVRLLQGTDGPHGVGGARNRACELATSSILIFLDADDVMDPERVARSVDALNVQLPQTENESRASADIIGGRFERIPKGSTPRYEEYHNRLETKHLFSHAFRDAPLAMPTIACRTAVWHAVPFREGHGVPEDLHFLYTAMKKGFRLQKLLGRALTYYRFHDSMTSLTLHRRTLLTVRVQAFEEIVLTRSEWREGFSIWNSGRDGRHVFNALSPQAQALVRAWGDVAVRKIGTTLHGRPVVHFEQLIPPIACCVALDRAGGQFEANLMSLNLRPGRDYVHLV